MTIVSVPGPQHSHRRRVVLGGMIASAGTLAQPAAPLRTTAAARFAYVGCRTTKERGARGEGISVYQVNSKTSKWTLIQLVKGLVNPSYLAFDKSQRFLYTVHGDMSEVSAFSVDPRSGELTFLNRQSTQGTNPAYLTVDDSNRFVLVANYATGSLAVLPRKDDGSLDTVAQLVLLPGKPGPNKVDQTFSHPHMLAYDSKRQFLIVPDKGLDRIFAFRFDATAGKLIAGDPAFVQVRPGAGPRHIAFHPTAPFAFVADELEASVGAYQYDATHGALTQFQVIPSAPDTFTGANTAAEINILPSGRFIFVSNRGHDSVGSFSVDAASGRLAPVQWTSSEGKGPRFCTLDPTSTFLYAANENSDTIVTFRVDGRTGRLRRTGPLIQTASPVCIVFSTI